MKKGHYGIHGVFLNNPRPIYHRFFLQLKKFQLETSIPSWMTNSKIILMLKDTQKEQSTEYIDR